MNTCETCIHWNTEEVQYRETVHVNYQTWVRMSEVDKATVIEFNADTGTCEKALEGWMWEPPEPLPLAVCWDGSEYRATLHTHKTFGCVLHEAP